MKLLIISQGEAVENREVLFGSALCGVRVKGITFERGDFEEIMQSSPEKVHEYLVNNLAVRFGPNLEPEKPEKQTRKIKLSMDGLRHGLTRDTMELREVIEECFEHVPEHAKEELVTAFDAIACTINGLNCVSLDGDEDFNDMNETEVKHLGEGYD